MKTYPVLLLCHVMQVNPCGYYAWLKAPEPKNNSSRTKLKERVKELFNESHGSFGSRRISRHLKNEGLAVGRFKAGSLMKELNLFVRKKRRYVMTTDSKHNHKVADNLLDRNFNPDKPNQVWTTDITYLKSQSGWVFLAGNA